MSNPHRLIITLLLAQLGSVTALAGDALYEREPVNYLTAAVEDPVARLAARIDAGQVKLAYDANTGYLPALLKALDVPVSSQVLVFTKTSLQRDRINPRRPRAVYFNDDVYVGYVQGGDVIEISSTDPVLGPVFYTLRQAERRRPAFTRQTDACLQCHAGSMTHDLPGHLVRSVYPDADGQPILSAGTFRTNPASPLKQRWGGWYVTGTTGDQKHMGNVFAPNPDAAERTDFTAGTNLTTLEGRFDTSPYPSPHSDVVALMVMEHQAFVHNMTTRASVLTRVALHDAVEMNKALGRPLDHRSDSTVSRIKNAVEPLLKALLFSEEAALTGPVKGTSGFTESFAKLGPRDGKGRSLRDFDLAARMFKHPCSYMIYGQPIDRLQDAAREQLYRRLFEVLSGRDGSKEFAHLTADDRRAVLEILVGTKKGLPEYFRAN
jgi:hypothetical protein